jgi:tetratricopeptide (TPR) repeat protein
MATALDLLAGGAADLPARLRTMRDAIAWSHDLLQPDEQRLFRRLSVFVGGFTLEGGEAVGGKGGDELPSPSPPLTPSVLASLRSLVDKSLVQTRGEIEGGPRFGMLETIREFAHQQLAASGELDACRARHAALLLTLAETAEPALDGPEQRRWLALLEAEHDNLRAALSWTLSSGDGTIALRLAGTLWRFWSVHGHLSEGRVWLERALTRGQETDLQALVPTLNSRPLTPELAKALHGAGALAFRQGDHARARERFEASVALHWALGDRLGLAHSVASLGVIASFAGEHNRATSLLTESVRLYGGVGDELGLSRALGDLGRAALLAGAYARAVELLQDGVQRLRRLGHDRLIARTLTDLGRAVAGLGDYDRAAALHTESLALYRGVDEKWGSAVVLANLADLARRRGDLAAAERRYRESLALWRELDGRAEIAACLAGLAEVALLQDDAPAAARLLGAAAAFGVSAAPRVAQAAGTDRDLPAAVCRALGETAFAAARATGQVRAAELVAALALGRTPSVAPRRGS